MHATRTHHHTSFLPSLALLLGLKASAGLPAQATLVNQATGEGYRPEVNEDGELEEPPDWVSGSTSNNQLDPGTLADPGDSAAAAEVLADADLCRSPIGDWLASQSASTELVSSALHDPGVRAELVEELESFIHHQLLIELAGTGIDISRPTVAQLHCDQCPMTYVECLLAGHAIDWCKRHPLNCPLLSTSALSITVPVLSPNAGALTFDASASYRLLSTEWEDVLEREWCLTVRHYDTEGFGLSTAFIEGRIEAMLAEGRLCRLWPF